MKPTLILVPTCLGCQEAEGTEMLSPRAPLPIIPLQFQSCPAPSCPVPSTALRLYLLSPHPPPCSVCSLMTVTLGAHNIKRKERTQQTIPVREIIRPSGYTSETFLNDIMLLQLSRKARLDANVRPIRLPKRNVWVRPGMVCSVAGWGQFRMDSSSGAEKLHEVELEIQKDEQCMSHYNHLYNPATQMCVGNPRRKKSALQGDSGGPLVCNNVAQGIVSCVKHCGTPPLVYTRISGYMHWIEKIMRHFTPSKYTSQRHSPLPG
uniref:Peptidase S1 domain-containing protein n=1 Tax=Panthera leo TaxID=9689 RepID=A0A8C8Y9R0_PANLE